MKRILIPAAVVAVAAAFLLVNFSTPMAAGEAKVGKAAPDFTLTDTNGNSVTLSDYSGKYVVLEWINYDCPFVAKHYDAKNMQGLQNKYREQGVVWLAVNSSAAGKQGQFSNEEIHKRLKKHASTVDAYLLDGNGDVGRTYGATHTPHMYIINPEGTLIYMGAIDSINSANIADIPKADNYVVMAFDAVFAGKEVPVGMTRAYGCTVKY
ncbi:MAG: thioredoxin family protein [Gemmatimonadetes bacterium]|nr:thioredoxin family protein [Gemmatimonadota bacterium]